MAADILRLHQFDAAKKMSRGSTENFLTIPRIRKSHKMLQFKQISPPKLYLEHQQIPCHILTLFKLYTELLDVTCLSIIYYREWYILHYSFY